MPRHLYPMLFMLISTFSLSLTGLTTKFLAQSIDSNLLTLLRFLVPAMILWLFFLGVKARVPERALLRPLWVRAFCISASQVCFIYSLNHLTLVESMVLFGTSPLFIPLLEKLIFGVSFHYSTLAGLLLTFAGVVLLAANGDEWVMRPALLVGLASGLFNAGSQLSLYRASKSSLNAFEINFWTFSIAALFALPLLVISGAGGATLITTEVNAFWLVMQVVVMSLLIITTQVNRSKAYRLAQSGSQLAPLIFTNVLFSAIWQGLFFDVTFTEHQLLGLVLIVAASSLNILLPRCLAYLQLKHS